MKLPPSDDDYSTRMKLVKEGFTESWLAAGLPESTVTAAQRERGERGIWQPRYWEHMIEDCDDLERHTDYIHWNPRKHELVKRVRDWQWSSFFRFVEIGHYSMDWGGTEPDSLRGNYAWGE